MKKHSLFTAAALVCGMLLSTTLFAQKPTLEASLPAQLQKDLPELKANIGFLMDKVLAVNPGFKNKQQLLPNLTSALEQLKKQKPSLAAVKIPAITVSSYDELIAAKTKQLGAESGVVKILNAFKDGVNKANDDGEVITLMATLVKSPAFQTIAPADKDMFYNAFASAKAAADYGVKNNLTVMVTSPNSYRGVGGINAGKDDDEYYMKRGAGCHWLLTVAGGAIGAVAGGLGAGAGAAAGFALGANYCY